MMDTTTMSMFMRLHGPGATRMEVEDIERELGPIQSMGPAKGSIAHRPMGEPHREALVELARRAHMVLDPQVNVESLDQTAVLDDGDLRWCFGGGQDLLFTVVDTQMGEFVRAMRQKSDSWELVADRFVVHQDVVGTARTIWQLVALLTY